MALNPQNIANGQEQYEVSTCRVFRKPTTRCYYDYRHTNGKLFSCSARTLDEAREKRDKWLDENA